MNIHFTHTPDSITLSAIAEKPGLFARLTGGSRCDLSFSALPETEQALIFALGDIRALDDASPGAATIDADTIRLTHDAAAALSADAARALGLPDDIHLLLATDVAGTLGSPDFRLSYEWRHRGQRQSPRRSGCLLFTSQGVRRIPLWMKRALDIADGFDPTAKLSDHWAGLAAFRRALEPNEDVPDQLPQGTGAAQTAMTAFLRGLRVQLADRFSISPDEGLSQFEVLPFSGAQLESDGVDDDLVSETHAELSGELLTAFQYKLYVNGASPAYRLADNTYLVIDRAAMPVLAEMARAQRASRTEREAFIRNPRAFIARSVTDHMIATGELDGLSQVEQEARIEDVVGPALVETREYAARVIGVQAFERAVRAVEGGTTTWMPELFPAHVVETLESMPLDALGDLHHQMQQRADDPGGSVLIGSDTVVITPERVASVLALHDKKALSAASGSEPADIAEAKPPPLILTPIDNYDDVGWAAGVSARTATVPLSLPNIIKTTLKPHQLEGFNWAVSAWRAGLPGILNADEQGLGKTLQTIAFLAWLQGHMRFPDAAQRGPILVVAPTSLLVNWEEEVARHVQPDQFGYLNRLYGGSIATSRQQGHQGTEISDGREHLDLRWLREAIQEGRAHKYWFLTTYTTLTNYQHSLGTIPFSAVVFDEIQAAKNQDTIRSNAVATVRADFRIGLTGTPIENTTLDLWTIMDRLAPGALGAGKEFRERYGTATEDNMTELHARVFKPQGAQPPLGLRRTKDEAARDLPTKTRRLHPREMPPPQAREYESARSKLATGGRGAALKMLHHIRSVSVHPGFADADPGEGFVALSARLQGTMSILSRVHAAGERALVFIEHRNIQFRFAELVRQKFGLAQVDIINGGTPISRRQEIVNRFQTHLTHDRGFDLLVLGPKAAGTGLTLTAATHVIHLSRWWNPAVEEQCNDRIHRIGQQRPVTIHVPMAIHGGYREHSFDCLLHSLMQRKRRLAAQALWPMGDTHEDASRLQELLSGGGSATGGDAVDAAMRATFERDGLLFPPPDADGSITIS
jgi:superfamily II DNA or RNA helicase